MWNPVKLGPERRITEAVQKARWWAADTQNLSKAGKQAWEQNYKGIIQNKAK